MIRAPGKPLSHDVQQVSTLLTRVQQRTAAFSTIRRPGFGTPNGSVPVPTLYGVCTPSVVYRYCSGQLGGRRSVYGRSLYIYVKLYGSTAVYSRCTAGRTDGLAWFRAQSLDPRIDGAVRSSNCTSA